MIDIPPSYYWLILGAICLMLEAFGISGVGFLFAGLGALTTGVIIEAGVVAMDAHIAQFAWFFATTTVWTVVLWKPLRKMRAGKAGYNNMVGDSCKVLSAVVTKSKPGEVAWSGTRMQALLSPHSKTDAVHEGDTVTITDVKGATLIVKLHE